MRVQFPFSFSPFLVSSTSSRSHPFSSPLFFFTRNVLESYPRPLLETLRSTKIPRMMSKRENDARSNDNVIAWWWRGKSVKIVERFERLKSVDGNADRRGVNSRIKWRRIACIKFFSARTTVVSVTGVLEFTIPFDNDRKWINSIRIFRMENINVTRVREKIATSLRIALFSLRIRVDSLYFLRK